MRPGYISRCESHQYQIRCPDPAGEPLGHVDNLPVGVHDFVAATLTGVL